ncbi:MAG: hypothetical protein FWD58_01080 [Firmicutes bacterium]|nr:hypothetical protein [Bacillota bacterium]
MEQTADNLKPENKKKQTLKVFFLLSPAIFSIVCYMIFLPLAPGGFPMTAEALASWLLILFFPMLLPTAVSAALYYCSVKAQRKRFIVLFTVLFLIVLICFCGVVTGISVYWARPVIFSELSRSLFGVGLFAGLVTLSALCLAVAVFFTIDSVKTIKEGKKH